MLDSDPELAEMHGAYRAQLRAVFEEIEPWWRRLKARHDRRALTRRWPCGKASHPRVLGVYARHHRAVEQLFAARRRGPAPAASFADDGAWGVEAEPDPETLITPEPRRLLVDRLQVEDPELYAELIHLLLSPVGVEPEPRPTLRGLGALTGGGDRSLVGAELRRPRAFRFVTRHGVEGGVERLLACPDDLREGPTSPRVDAATCSEAHHFAMLAYHEALEGALAGAERWWTGLIASFESRGYTREEAREAGYARHFAGPAASPELVGVVQAYWRLCEEINAAVQPEQRVPPEQFLLAWLGDGRHESWVQVLSAWPYWPVIRDGEGGSG